MSSIEIEGLEFTITGRLLKKIALRDNLVDSISDPEKIMTLIRQRHFVADFFEFSQKLNDQSPKFTYHMEWDNWAAIPISSYENWLKKQVHPNTRSKINKSKKAGVEVKIEHMSHRLAEGLLAIFNETPERRGKKYSYYGRDIATIEKEWSHDTGRNDFLVAYFQDEVIGFIQLVYGSVCARTSGTVAKLAHRDKAPMNALIDMAVKRCVEKKLPFLVYGKYIYGKKGEDSLTVFKKNNGFVRIDVPRYFIPLSLRGNIGLRFGAHRRASEILPQGVLRLFSHIRNWRRARQV